jgi:hypothetical protein
MSSANGVRSLDVQCDNCRHRVIVNRIVEAGAGHHDHPIASRPASVILSQVTTIERRATIVGRRSSETRPSRTSSRSNPIAPQTKCCNVRIVSPADGTNAAFHLQDFGTCRQLCEEATLLVRV